MIPTTVTSSPSTPSVSTSMPTTASQQNFSTAMIGIASLILEGRAISEDEFQPPPSTATRSQPLNVAFAAGNYKDLDMSLMLSSSGVGGSGCQSPRPSTSRAAASSTTRHAINITSNPHPHLFSGGSTSSAGAASMFDDYFEEASAATSESTHQQRWAQKLCQLRQASPAASPMSRDFGLFEQRVGGSIEAVRGGEPEMVALAINTDGTNAERGDFEIIRRVMLNRTSLSTSAGSAASSPGSADNFLHSLQSLATTCLRSGPAIGDTSIRYNSSNTPFSGGGGIGTPKYSKPHSGCSGNSMLRATPPRCSNIFVSGEMPGSASSSGSGLQSPLASLWLPCVGSPSIGSGTASSSCSGTSSAQCNRREKFPPSVKISIPKNTRTPTSTRNFTKSPSTSPSYPQQGPHCEQFLRKMGLAKNEASDAEDHFCDMSYVNITCSRWRAYSLKMEAIIARGEPICIEVYLGPVGHKILLEQWILTQKDKVPAPTMTLPSLCSAIRSQLYFSQISAWCDLIKKADNTIYDTGRVIFSVATGAAGDLATARDTAGGNSNTNTPGTSPSSTGAGSSPTLLNANNSTVQNRRPRLNIFYRIKHYDSTACFNSKPNVHNFPNVVISDSCCISVCLKSLPRINGGIPKLGVSTQMQCDTYGNGADPSITCPVGARLSSRNTIETSAFAGVVSRPNTNKPPTIPETALAAAKPITSRQTTASSVSPPIKTNCDINKMESPAELLSTSVSSASAASCPSKGNHKCMFFIDEDELLDEGGDEQINDDDDDCTSVSGCGGGGESPNSPHGISDLLSHREKQLMKYRKRMLKRDKKTTRKTPTDFACAQGSADPLEEGQRFSSSAYGSNHNRSQPMEQGEVDFEENADATERKQRSTHSNLQYSASSSPAAANRHVSMVSTGTQTQLTCCQCGSEKALVCLNCDSCSSAASSSALNSARKVAVDVDDMDSCSISSSEIISTPRNNAELLLQAIQRTPKAAKNKKQPQAITGSPGCVSKNNNHIAAATAGAASSGCQVCKRQKMQHDFGNGDTVGTKDRADNSENPIKDYNEGNVDNIADPDVEKPNVPTSNYQIPIQKNRNQEDQHLDSLDKEYFISSTKLTPHIDKCSLYTRSSIHNIAYTFASSSSVSCDSACASTGMDDTDNTNTAKSRQSMRSCTPPYYADHRLTTNNSETSEAQFKTPTNAQQKQAQELRHQHKQTPKPTLLQISTTYQGGAGDASHSTSNGHYDATTPSGPHNLLLLRKGLPKVNLTPIFCNPSAANVGPPPTLTGTCHLSSLPIPISSCPALCATDVNSFIFGNSAIAAGGNGAATNTAIDINNIPVQKSYSAPTLPNSPSLSPRFAKQAAIYKRRSRHLSDRSDRSSLGSDEQFSDEDIDCGACSPATSPIKMRSSRCAANFGRRPLLGNLEESLFQKRLAPKIEVAGFKVLLGASGGFCPTQLTIPAAAYFYELHGETLSTPYVCEIRLPRKGYSVPRAGTVQATLLNPMGTVVRMFVIPYDMRDMPPLHQTFIRQRILADSNETVDANTADPNLVQLGSNNNTVGYHNGSSQLKSPMQMNGITYGNPNGETLSDDGDIGGIEVCGRGQNNNFTNNTTNNNNNNNNNNSTMINSNKYRLSPNGGLHGESNLGHFISAENMKRLRYSIHLRFQTSRSGRLSLHTDIRLLISRRTDCDTAAAHAKGVLEAPNDLITDTVMPTNPKYSARQENPNKI